MNSAVLFALTQNSDTIALASGATYMTYRDLRKEVTQLALRLRQEKSVALLMKNGIPWVVADLACIEAGVPCVPIPSFFTDEQCQHVLRDAGVSLILTDQPERFDGKVEKLHIAATEVTAIGLFSLPISLPPDIAKITYTSGTTGTPKGVCLTQSAMETVAISLLQALGDDVAKRHICLLPLAILLENVAGVYTALLAGATCDLSPVTHEPNALADAINQARATSCILVPELLRMLLAADRAMPTLRFAAVGGARVDPVLLKHAHAKGIPAYEGYGISENASVITVNTPTAFKHGSVGKVLPHIQLKVDEAGEIWLKHPLYSGYLGHGSPHDEWYATGDLGVMDEEGFLYLHGRKRHVFITSFGRNVSPEWPESLLNAHPAIAQAAVFGEARPFSVAVIVPRDATQILSAVMQVNARLPDYARIGAYVIAQGPFAPINGQLTGNGRLRRDVIAHAYAAHIDHCYLTETENYL